MQPAWLKNMEEARKCGSVGIILTGNTSDRVFCSGEDYPVTSLKYFLACYFAHQGYKVGYFTLSSGFQELIPPHSKEKEAAFFTNLRSNQNPTSIFTNMTRILRKKENRCVIIIEYADHIAPQSSGMNAILPTEQLQTLEILHGWGQDDDIKHTENLIILISHENSLNSLINQSGGYRSIQVDLPCLNEREDFINYILNMKKSRSLNQFGNLQPELEARELANITGGLRLIDIEELFRLSGSKDCPITENDVRETKKRTISSICKGLVQIIEPIKGFESVAGSYHAKDYLTGLKELWKKGHKSLPQAILLAGVPGCGKSHLVVALSKELGCPCLIMRNIRESWVGASERNLETVLWIAQNLSPCLLWTDEIDQAIGQRGTGPSGDSGTSERMLARIFEFFGSAQNRGKIIWIATTNRPDILDPALLDRFQIKIPFLHPTQKERSELLVLLAKEINRTFNPEISLNEISAMQNLNMLTVRSLQEVIVKAGLIADEESETIGALIGKDHFLKAVDDYKPTFNLIEHEFIALKALEMTSFNSLLPWMGQKGLRQNPEIPQYLEGIVNRDTGRLNMVELSKRINELQKMLFTEKMMR